MSNHRHNYEYQFDVNGSTAPARVVRMVGSKKRVLEIGAGPGSITRMLTGANNCSVVALERDDSAILKLKSFCEKVITADLNDQDWPKLLENESAFDVLVCADVLEHVLNPAEVLSDIVKFMGKKTSLVVSLPHVGHSAIHACLFHSDFEYGDWGLLDRTHLHFFGISNITSLFSTAGLKIIEAEFVTCEPEQTEFADLWAKLPESLKQELRANPFGVVYQIVLRAVRLENEGEAIDLRSTPLTSFKQVTTLNWNCLRSFLRKYTTPKTRVRIRSIINFIGFKKS